MNAKRADPIAPAGPLGRSGGARRKAREFQRIPVRCGCWLEHDQATIYGTTVDVGRGGLFLRTALPMRPGAAVRVTLSLPGSATVVADGKVVRMVAPSRARSRNDEADLDAGRDRPGLGVSFERLPDGEALDAFLCGSLQAQRDAEAGAVGG